MCVVNYEENLAGYWLILFMLISIHKSADCLVEPGLWCYMKCDLHLDTLKVLHYLKRGTATDGLAMKVLNPLWQFSFDEC